jgi:hypothetical protein
MLSHSIEPMDADDWLKATEKKLQVIQCTNQERVLFAAHQLVAPAADWSDAYVEAHCQTPFRDSGNEASIRVPRMFHSHV